MRPFSLNIRGKLISYEEPVVMGIINATPDSFYAGSRHCGSEDIARTALRMATEGAAMLDLGAYSSRPGAEDVSPREEWERLQPAIKAIKEVCPDIPLSVDTFRAEVAVRAIEAGADIVNDISGGKLDPEMVPAVAQLQVPYIIMHMRGTPQTMQKFTDYGTRGVSATVIEELSRRVEDLAQAGVADIIVDPGFGFAKTTEQNFELMQNLEAFSLLERPVLTGISRKSMITRTLDIDASEALNGTTVLNTVALMRGAAILRVHDVQAARQAVLLTSLCKPCYHSE
ncbi:MAG: dihydropteroate synthase [Muribaculaceae bacterium]|nr:dihydropteroate synthase [Muribaculaceae bacterium]